MTSHKYVLHVAAFIVAGLLAILLPAIAIAQRSEGISVHGHWTIEVRNSDGTVASHHEFENELVDTRGLTFTLARRNSPGRWSVLVGGIPSPCATDGGNFNCVLSESGTVGWTIPPIANLELSVIGTQAREQLQLSGVFTAPAAGEISLVQTSLDMCPNTSSPSLPCTAFNRNSFTRTSLESGTSKPPITVASGQIVQVTVVISFS